jgi:hypothetical protein
MSETLADIQRRLGASRLRLEDLTRRLAGLRAQVTGAQGAPLPAQPLFPPDDGSGRSSIQDVELEFQALNGDQPERKGR